LFAVAVACGACGTQLDSGYEGDPIATLHAEVTAAPAAGTPPLSAAIWWVGLVNTLLQRVDVEVIDELPVAVVLQLTQPPPDDVLIDRYGPRFACEPLRLIAQYDDWSRDPSGTYGVTENHVVCYMKDPVVAGSALATMLAGAYEPGFHVIALEHRFAAWEAWDQGTADEWDAAHQQCQEDFLAMHEGEEGAAATYCYSDIAHRAEDDLDTVMPITTGDYLDPSFHLET
jgi:hypothetical protein